MQINHGKICKSIFCAFLLLSSIRLAVPCSTYTLRKLNLGPRNLWWNNNSLQLKFKSTLEIRKYICALSLQGGGNRSWTFGHKSLVVPQKAIGVLGSVVLWVPGAFPWPIRCLLAEAMEPGAHYGRQVRLRVCQLGYGVRKVAFCKEHRLAANI